ncbi:hypothetical protein SEA_PARVUSTARDA_4 [Gordonia phage ParvusTarda]|uniref:Minor tail protein n=1 Tax=Gordonia phage ParvusTarda TaxID=2927261 RepID=A0A9E7QRB2_9CAUD|nr:hypothetical protein SEA_PARVUSTARDA_4 [Gordonia phage ParvusTarda]
MANVWYIGEAQERTLNFGASTFTWNIWNGWSIPESAFTSGQLTELDADPGFLLGQEGPRIDPPWQPDASVGIDALYLKEMRRIADAVKVFDPATKISKQPGNTRVYTNDSAGNPGSLGYTSVNIANTIPVRDANGRSRFSDPAETDHAATKNYVDTTTPKVYDGGVMSAPNNIEGALGTWAPEGSGFVHLPHLFNDLAYNTIRGGAVTITQNGTPVSSGSIDKIFEPNTTALSIALVDKATDVFVIEVDLCVGFRYGTVGGIAMPTQFRGKNVKIEGYWDGAWQWIDQRTNLESGLMIKRFSVPTTSTAMTKLRYTIQDFYSSVSFRISSVFCLAYNSPLLEQGFVSRAGGDLYGPLYVNTDPVRADELARKNYVDGKFYGVTGPATQPSNTTELLTLLSSLGFRASGSSMPITTGGAVAFTGAMRLGAAVRTATFTLSTSAQPINICNAAGAITCNLFATTTAGYRFVIKRVNATGDVTILPPSGGNIDGQASFVLDAQYKWVELTSHTTSGTWFIVGRG